MATGCRFGKLAGLHFLSRQCGDCAGTSVVLLPLLETAKSYAPFDTKLSMAAMRARSIHTLQSVLSSTAFDSKSEWRAADVAPSEKNGYDGPKNRTGPHQ